jgi:hypothetical protein
MLQIKMAVSRKLCGAVIGQKGQTIRDFMQDSGATIRVQPLSELTPSDSERLITVSGGRDKVLRAVALVLNTVRQQAGAAGRGRIFFHDKRCLSLTRQAGLWLASQAIIKNLFRLDGVPGSQATSLSGRLDKLPPM